MLKHLLLSLLFLVEASISFAQKDVIISGGNSVSSMVCANRKVYVWGNNSTTTGAGLLGTGGKASFYNTPQPVTIPGNMDIMQVNSGSGNHFIALDMKSNPWAWGNNSLGQVGNGVASGQNGFISTPTRVLALTEIASSNKDSSNQLTNVAVVYAGFNNSFAILNNGDLVSWGANGKGFDGAGYDDCYGQLGNGVLAGSGISVTQTAAGYVKTYGGTKLTGVIQVFAGDNYAMALVDPDGDGVGTVYTWGDGKNGTLARNAAGTTNPGTTAPLEQVDPWARPARYADGTIMNNIVSINAGDVFGMALDTKGYIWTWGNGAWNNATGNTTVNYIGSDPRKVLKGTTTGNSNDGTYLLAKSIGAGQGFGMAVTVDGKPVAWGGGGPLDGGGFNAGSATGAEYISYTAGANHTDVIAINRGDTWGFYERADGTMWAWGGNSFGQLGLGTASNENVYASKVNPPVGCGYRDPMPAVALSPGSQTVCASSFAVGNGITFNSGFVIGAILAPTYKIEWFVNGVSVKVGTAANSLTYLLPNTATLPATVRVEVSYNGSNNGSVVYKTATAESVISIYPATFSIPTNVTYCNTSAFVNVNSTATTRPVYSWYPSAASTTILGTSIGSSSDSIDVTNALAGTGTDKIVYVEETGYASGTFLKKTEGCTSGTAWFASSNNLAGSISQDNSTATGITIMEPITITDVSFLFQSTLFTVGTSGSATISVGIYGSKMSNGGYVADNATLLGTLNATYNRTRTANDAQDVRTDLVALGSVTLQPGTYFIGVSNYTGTLQNPQVGSGSCKLSNLVDDVTGKIISLVGVSSYGNPNSTSSGMVYNINFKTLQHYCDRVPVFIKMSCQSCRLPISPTISTTATSLCTGQAAVLTSNYQANSTDYTFSWYNGNPADTSSKLLQGPISNISNTSLTVTNSGTYTMLVVDKYYPDTKVCWKTATVTITANATLPPTYQLVGGGPYCSNAKAPLVNVALTGTAPFSLSWTDGTTTKSVTGISTSPYSITPTTSGLYSITTIKDNNCNGVVNTTNVKVTKIQQPDLVWDVTKDSTYCAGSTNATNLTAKVVTAANPGSYSYKWTNLTDNSIITNNTISLTTPTGTKTYGLTVTDSAMGLACNQVMRNRVITQYALPTYTITGGGTYCSGDPISSIQIKIGGGVPPYQLSYQDGAGMNHTVNVTGINPVSYSILEKVAGVYQVVLLTDASQKACQAIIDASKTATIIINPKPTLTPITQTPNCATSTAGTIALSSLFTFSPVGGNTSYKCSDVNAVSASNFVKTNITGTYTVSATYSVNGCSATGINTITINAGAVLQTISIATLPFPIPAIFTFDVTSQNLQNVKWYDNTKTQILGTGNTYSPIIPYTNTTPDSLVSGSYSYYYSATVNGCESQLASANAVVGNCPTIKPSVGPDVSICKAVSSITVKATNNGTGILQWFDSPNTATATKLGTGASYTTTVTAKGNYSYYVAEYYEGKPCYSPTAQVNVIVNSIPTVVWAASNPTLVCSDGASVLLNVNASPAGGIGTFSVIAGLIKVTQTSANLDPVMSYAGPKTISYSYTDLNGCTSSISTTVNVLDTPEPVTLSISTLSIPIPQNFTFDATNQALSNVKWYSANNVILGTGNTYSPVIAHTGTQPDSLIAGCQTVYYTQTINGCESRATSAIACINVCPSYAPIAGVDQKVCFNNLSSTVLTATSAYGNNQLGQLRWFTGANTKTSIELGTGNNLYVTASTAGVKTYYVSEFNYANTCYGPTTPVTLTVNPLPTPTIFVSNPVLCNTDPTQVITLNPAINANSSLTCSSPTMLTANTFKPNGNGEISGTYTLNYSYTDANGCVGSAKSDFTVNYTAPPIAQADVTVSTTDLAGNTVKVSAQGTAIKWYADPALTSPIIGGTGSPLDTKMDTIGVTSTTSKNRCFYATQTVNGCESKADNVCVTITPSTSTVVKVSSITLDKTTLSLNLASSPVTIVNTISPITATNKTVSWSVMPTGVVSVSQSGIVTVVALGTATITCSANDGSGVTATCNVTVPNVQPTAVVLDNNPISMIVGDTKTITASVLPTMAPQAINWSSSDLSIAAVNPNGVISALKVGTVIITATSMSNSTLNSSVIVSVLATTNGMMLLSATSFDPTPDNESKSYFGIDGIVQYGLYSGKITVTPNLATNISANVFNASPLYAITKNPIILDSIRFSNNSTSDNQLIFSPSTALQSNLLQYAISGVKTGTNYEVRVNYCSAVSSSYSACAGNVISLRAVVNADQYNQNNGAETTQLSSGMCGTYTWNQASISSNAIAADGNLLFRMSNQQTGSCRAVSIKNIEIWGTPKIAIYASQGSQVCVGENITLQSSIDYNASYLWEVNSGSGWSTLGTNKIQNYQTTAATTYNFRLTLTPLNSNSIIVSDVLSIPASVCCVINGSPAIHQTVFAEDFGKIDLTDNTGKTFIMKDYSDYNNPVTVTKTTTTAFRYSLPTAPLGATFHGANDANGIIDGEYCVAGYLTRYNAYNGFNGAKLGWAGAITGPNTPSDPSYDHSGKIDGACLILGCPANTKGQTIYSKSISGLSPGDQISFETWISVYTNSAAGVYNGVDINVKVADGGNASNVVIANGTATRQADGGGMWVLLSGNITITGTSITLNIINNSANATQLVVDDIKVMKCVSTTNIPLLITQAPSGNYTPTSIVSVTANKDGQLYLVPEGTTKSKAAIINASIVSVSNTSNVVSTISLPQTLTIGSRLVFYAIDGNDSISASSPVITIISQTVIKVSKITLFKSLLVLTPTSAPVSFIFSVLPVNATNKMLIWSVSQAGIISVSQTGIVTVLNPGSTILTCTAADGSGVFDECLVQVTDIYPSSITINNSPFSMKVGDTKTITATVLPSNATVGFTWTSSDITLATINQNGVISALKAGTVTISATSTVNSAITTTAMLTITENPMLTVSTNAIKISAKANSTATVNVSSNIQWTAVCSESWLMLSPTSAIGNAKLLLTTQANNGITRTATITVSASGVANQIITVTQDAELITVLKTIPDTTIAIDAISQKYWFAKYFKYTGASTISYSVSSTTPNVVTANTTTTDFAFAQYSNGVATLTVTALSGLGTKASISFKVTVTSLSTVNCSSLKVYQDIIPVSCNGLSDGAISVTATGGVAPYSYKWSTDRTDNSIVDVVAGDYTVIVSDSNNCSVAKTFTITEPTAITITKTINLPKCSTSDGSISLAVTGGKSPYTYSWTDGSTNSTLSSLAAGIYSVIINDASGCEQYGDYELNNIGAPEIILDSIDTAQCNQNIGAINVSVSGGIEPYTYNWSDANSSTTQDISGLAVGFYDLVVTDNNGCKASLSAEVPSRTFAQPTIDLVTVNETSGKNMIIWRKEFTNTIDYYTIYRETYVAGEYAEVDKIPYALTSIYTDDTANSKEQSWRYKIAATDMCGNESPLSPEHKTIHLQKNIGLQNVVNLDWDAYEGIDFYTYVIYRESTKNGIEEIKKIPSSITRYTDLLPPSDVQSYYVAIDLPTVIDPSKLKSSSGPYSQSISNMAESVLTKSKLFDVNNAMVHPNPANSIITVTFPSNGDYIVSIFDAYGRQVSQTVKVENSKSLQLSVSDLSVGVYSVKIIGKMLVTSATFIKE